MAGWRRGVAILMVLCGVGVAQGQTLRVVPIPPHIRPDWQQVPDNPKVFHAPNIPADVFKGAKGAGYYLKLGELWYHSRTMNGPWTLMSEVPEFLYQIGPQYYKTAQAAKPAPPGSTALTPAAPGGSASPATPPQVPPAASVPPSSTLRPSGGEAPVGPTAQVTPPALPPLKPAESPALPKPSPLAPPPEPILLNDPGPP